MTVVRLQSRQRSPPAPLANILQLPSLSRLGRQYLLGDGYSPLLSGYIIITMLTVDGNKEILNTNTTTATTVYRQPAMPEVLLLHNMTHCKTENGYSRKSKEAVMVENEG